MIHGWMLEGISTALHLLHHVVGRFVINSHYFFTDSVELWGSIYLRKNFARFT
jgi:hypothetical protein